MEETLNNLRGVEGQAPQGYGEGATPKSPIYARLEEQLEKIVNKELVYVDEKLRSYRTICDDELQYLAVFLANVNVFEVFASIKNEEKMGFNDDELSLYCVQAFRGYGRVIFRLPTGKEVSKEIKVPKVEDMDKPTYEKYLRMKNILEQKRDELVKKAENLKREWEEEERKRKEEEERKRKEEEYRYLKKRVEELEDEVALLKRIIRKKIPESEVEEEEEEEKELTSEEKAYLRENVFDC